MGKIKFGTDGWRAVMCEDFTFGNVEIVVQGICNYLIDAGKADMGLVIGYDTRFFSDRFARRSANVCNANGIKVFLTANDVPTPVVAFSILDKETAGALMFTASHNPSEYNGIKFIPEDAAPALPEVTSDIEAHVKNIIETGDIKKLTDKEMKEKGMTEVFNPTAPYMNQVKKILDLTAINNAKLKVVYDPLYATGRNYVPLLLKDITEFKMIHGKSDPYFGGIMPEPKGELLTDLIDEVTKTGAHLGLANDGDADRFGIVDSDGTFINPNQVLVLVYMHLLKNRGLKGDIARTVATTHLLDRIAEHYGFKAIETPVGFKYIGHELEKEGVILGGEESGGLSMEGHIPEKDGILALALITEIRAIEGKPLLTLLQEIYDQFGAVYTKRVDIHCTDEHKKEFFETIKSNPPSEIAGMKVEHYSDMDGMKLYLEDGSWILFRPSGTEPLVRIYFEALSDESLELMAKEAARYFMEE
ncbi:MAG: phosphoglucomutase/phosphomannomutase family protein [Candidatus Eremiobacteraeota bacterium]|nr:phosphoglucomutase/phosphomannomutase family protein [Candidatus Eremiobacteraeota bacterium]